jgi:hypothetical protein
VTYGVSVVGGEGDYSGLQLTVRLLGASLCLLLWAGRTTGQTSDLADEYFCTEARVTGKLVPCTAAPMNLNTDRRFELQGREGEYFVSGNWVELKSAILKSRAKIEARRNSIPLL